jgi:hypothetical protein
MPRLRNLTVTGGAKIAAGHKHDVDHVIYAWPVQSTSNRQTFGGTKVTYEVVMYECGCLYCNCAGWQFSKGDEKTCKHCNIIKEEASQRFAEYKRGDYSNFQVIEETVSIPTANAAVRRTTVVATPSVTPTPSKDPNIRRRYGRVIEV